MTASVPDNENLRRLLLARRLEALATGVPLALVPVLASIAVLLTMYADSALAGILAWSGTALVIVSAGVVVRRRLAPDATDVRVLERRWRAANIMLILGSLAWAVGLPLAASLPAARPHSIIAIVGAVLMGSVLLSHRTAPEAAITRVIAIGAGVALAEWLRPSWQIWPVLALIAAYAATVIGAIRVQDRAFRAVCQAELSRRESEQAVSRLLDDHEANAADWPWTVDPDGALRDVSERLAMALQTTPDALEGQDFLSLIEAGSERERIAKLSAERGAFHNEPVLIDISGERRLWRISGHARPGGQMTGTGRDVTNQPSIEQRVRAMACIDPLSGLANRDAFNRHLREVIDDNSAEPRPAALLYLDLDDFKAVNLSHGHLFADGLLREIGARLRRYRRGCDHVARLGGDAFAVLVEAPGGDGLLIERAHRLLAVAREPFRIEGQQVSISASVGIARAARGCDAAELMRRADLALHAAKAKGRDQLAIYDEALGRAARERRHLATDLGEALAREEMLLHYQPIIALQSGETVGYQALLRWKHPTRGMLMPGDFLPLGDQSEVAIALGDWVIRRALSDVATWPGDFRLALNLSPGQARNAHLIATVDSALAASGLSASRLEFEITEQALLHDAAAGGAMLNRLRALGAEIALGDLGTGYSSLSYLRRYCFDRVKINRSFVRDIETSDDAQAIVSAITLLAQALGMRTTAEGVERPGQLDLLRKLGCDEAQGFLILEPVEAAAIEEARARGEDAPQLGDEMQDYRAARQAATA